MTTTQGELAGLSRYIFRTPRWYTTMAFGMVIAILVGVAAFDSRFVLEDAWLGLFYLGIPTVIASVLTAPIDRALGGQFTFNRSTLLATVSLLVAVAVLVLAGLVATLTALGQNFVYDALIGVLALIFAFRFLVVHAVSRTHPIASLVPASVQTLTAGLFLFVYSGTMNFLVVGDIPYLQALLSRPEHAPPEITNAFVPVDFGLLIGMSALYTGVAYAFLRVLDRPWRRSLDVSALDFLRGFIGHIAEGSRELEDFFEEIGEEAVVPVTVLSFRRQDGTEKARWVLPMIHPGPMGDIGGGNLPQRVAESAEGLAFPPHATAGHDFNLVTEREVDTLIEAAERAADRIEYTESGTPPVRIENGDASVLGQRIDGDGLFVATFAPGFADDVEYAVGLAAGAEARVEGLDDVLIVDAHNSNNGLQGDDLGHVVPGSRRSFELIQAVSDAAASLADAETGPIELGTAWEPTNWKPEEGIGPLGIRVAVVTVAGTSVAYVLVDGNNMEPGLRETIVAGIDGVDEVEVMTTDTHIVNIVQSSNQVGGAIDHGELVSRVADLVDRAAADREPVEAGMASETAAVTVFGNDRTETLASQANAVISMGAGLAAAVVVGTAAVTLLIFVLT
jgi:putative membrane protein